MMEELLIFAFSGLLGLGCFGAIGWVILSPETLNVDKIFSIIACLVLGMVFLGISAWMLFNTHLRTLWGPESAAASKPGAASPKKKEAVPQEAGKPAS